MLDSWNGIYSVLAAIMNGMNSVLRVLKQRLVGYTAVLRRFCVQRGALEGRLLWKADRGREEADSLR
jgi:hypothetical protein